MNCRRCGKALGTDRGICPFCGAMLSKDQMEIYKQDKKENMYKPELITEKYSGTSTYYEKRNDSENKAIGFIIIVGVLLFVAIIALIIVLN